MNAMWLNTNVCLLQLPSELTDPDEAPYLHRCAPQSSGYQNYIILDFSAVEMLNGLGATMLVKFSALAELRGQHLLAIGVSDHYRDVLRITGLHEVISIQSSQQEAFTIARVSGGNAHSFKVQQVSSRDTSYWAELVDKLRIPMMPPEAINRNMNSRRVVGPVLGFGQLWQKIYRLKVEKLGLTPEDLIRTLKQNLPRFQPSYNRFYPTVKGIQPGEVLAIDSSTPGGPVSTGVMLLYADDRSFTFITPQGHPESGWVSFSSFKLNSGIIVQILGLARANDPVYEAAFRMVGSKMQVKIWTHVMTSLAMYLGIPADVNVEAICVDRRIQWSQARNVWYNAQIRTLFYMPFLWLKRGTRGLTKTEQ